MCSHKFSAYSITGGQTKQPPGKNIAEKALKQYKKAFSKEQVDFFEKIRDINYRIMSLEACDPSTIYTDDINHIINETLNFLPEQTQRIFRMSRYEQMSVKEIAEKMGVSSKTVEYHITKALKELRISLKDYLPMALFFFKEII